MRKTAEFLISP